MTTLAVVTGASRGIGAGLARSAAADGAVVAACNRSASGADHELIADLGDPKSWGAFASWFAGLLAEVAPDDVVFVHNAATLTPIGFAGEVDSEAYQTNVILNSAAPQVLGDAVIGAVNSAGLGAVIVQLSSGAGKNPYPGWTSYCAAKAAVDMWVRSVGVEQAQRNDAVRAVAVSPGVVATEMQAEIRASSSAAFPNVERFQEMHDGGALADANEVGSKIWALARSTDWANGSVLDLRDAD